jgi:hypothetical protein
MGRGGIKRFGLPPWAKGDGGRIVSARQPLDGHAAAGRRCRGRAMDSRGASFPKGLYDLVRHAFLRIPLFVTRRCTFGNKERNVSAHSSKVASISY